MIDDPGLARGIDKMYVELERLTFCGFWIFDDREVQLETYPAAASITWPREIAMYARIFEHYSSRAVYGQQARDLIGQAIADHAEDSILSNSGNFADQMGHILA
jgi:hypothetical protein